MRYALLGATGTVGRALAAELAEAGERFRVVGRSEESLRRMFGKYGDLAEIHAADLGDPKAAAEAVRGVETVIYLVGVPYWSFELHPKLTQVAVDAARAEGVRQYVHLSTVYPYGRPAKERVDESHPREPHTFKGQKRKEQEEIVLKANDADGMRTVVLRPPDFYGPDTESSYVRAIFDAAIAGGKAKANVIGPIDTPHEFIFVPDLARTLLAVARKPEAYGQAWNVGGPSAITTRRFAELVFAEVGQQPRLRVAGKTMLRVMGLFSPFLREVVEMHYLWTTPVILDDSRLRQLLPGLSKTSYEDGIRQTIAAMKAEA